MTVALALPAQAAIEGVVTTTGGILIEQARITAECSEEERYTNPAGVFRLEKAVPPCTLQITHPRMTSRELVVTESMAAPLTIVLAARQEVYEQIAVTADPGGDQRLSSATVDVTSVHPTDAAVPPTTTTELVASVPGVDGSGQGGLFQTPSIRGMAGQRVLMTMSDMVVVSERRAGAALSFVDPSLLENAEVLRGPASTLYGSGAMGGVVRLLPRRGDGWLVETSVSSEGAANGQTVAWGDERWSLGIARRASSNGSDAAGEELNDHHTQLSALAAGSIDLGWASLELLVVPANGRDIGKSNSDYPRRETNYPEERHLLFKVALADDDWSAHVYTHANELETRVERDGVTTDVYNDALDYGAGARVTRDVAPHLATTFGLDLFGRSGVDSHEDRLAPGEEVERLRTLDGGHQQDAAAYTTVRWTPGPVTSQAGIRYTHQRQGNGAADSIGQGAWSGFLGVAVPVAVGLEVVANAGTGVRFPTLTERFFTGTTGRGGVVGNADLDPETSTSIDAGLRWFGGRLFVETFVFHTEVRDYIEQVDVDEDVSTFVNLTRGRIRGVELDGFFQIDDRFRLRFAGHALEGRDGHGAPLGDIPPRRLDLGGEAKLGRLTLAVDLEYRDAKRDPGPGEARTGHARLIDARAGWELRNDLALWATAANVLDESYRPSADSKSPLATGRAFGLGIRWRP